MPSFSELLSEEVMRTLDAGRTAAGRHPPDVLPWVKSQDRVDTPGSLLFGLKSFSNRG